MKGFEILTKEITDAAEKIQEHLDQQHPHMRVEISNEGIFVQEVKEAMPTSATQINIITADMEIGDSFSQKLGEQMDRARKGHFDFKI